MTVPGYAAQPGRWHSPCSPTSWPRENLGTTARHPADTRSREENHRRFARSCRPAEAARRRDRQAGWKSEA